MTDAENKILPIEEIAGKILLDKKDLFKYGDYIAKVKLESRKYREKKGKLVLVTAINPTPYGEGKTTISIGLSDSLNRIKKRSIATLREPSLGPVFGMKGGATGGGASRILPSEEINLHFTGDNHAVTSAHNLLAALIDNQYSKKNVEHFQPRDIYFHRVIDMNDRALRKIIIGVGDDSGQVRESKFEITAASEIMAVLGLSYDLNSLKKNLSNILIGESYSGSPVFSSALNSSDALAILLKDAVNPNMVQSLEGNPVFVHTGPFANIAHGTSSIISTDMALRLADYVVIEAGFGSDLGAEKFFDIVSRKENMNPPDYIVIVATMRAIKHHGGVNMKSLLNKDIESVKKGFENLAKHIENMQSFNRPVCVAINKFNDDIDEELQIVKTMCEEKGVKAFITDVWNDGGSGALNIAEHIVKETSSSLKEIDYVYLMNDSIEEKIKKVAYRIYGAYGISIPAKIKEKIRKITDWGFSNLPICIAKTQYSFSDNEKLLGRPRNFNIDVKDVKLASGAGFIVVYLGSVMTMPGLPETPASVNMRIDESGKITGI